MGFLARRAALQNAAHGCAVDRLWVTAGAERRDTGHTQVTMGINNFHKWARGGVCSTAWMVTRNSPVNVSAQVDSTFGCTQKASRVDCEDLLVDMNSLVHGAARKANTPAQAHKLILKRLEGLLDERRPGPTVRASQTLALFSDGPAPLSA